MNLAPPFCLVVIDGLRSEPAISNQAGGLRQLPHLGANTCVK
jgi:hypothetical protein